MRYMLDSLRGRQMRLHREHPSRGLYFVDTERVHLDSHERRWIGVPSADAACAKG